MWNHWSKSLRQSSDWTCNFSSAQANPEKTRCHAAVHWAARLSYWCAAQHLPAEAGMDTACVHLPGHQDSPGPHPPLPDLAEYLRGQASLPAYSLPLHSRCSAATVAQQPPAPSTQQLSAPPCSADPLLLQNSSHEWRQRRQLFIMKTVRGYKWIGCRGCDDFTTELR